MPSLDHALKTILETPNMKISDYPTPQNKNEFNEIIENGVRLYREWKLRQQEFNPDAKDLKNLVSIGLLAAETAIQPTPEQQKVIIIGNIIELAYAMGKDSNIEPFNPNWVVAPEDPAKIQ